MANVSYTTSLSNTFIRRAMDANIADQWIRVESAERAVKNAHERYTNQRLALADASLTMFARFPFMSKEAYDAYVEKVYDLSYAKIEMMSRMNKLSEEQDRYNELVIAQEDWDASARLTEEEQDDDDHDEEDDHRYVEVPEIDLRKRKAPSRKRKRV